MKKVIVIGILILWLAHAASAGIFYSGNITVKSIAVDVTIGNTANVTAEYVIVNSGGQESVSLGYSEVAELRQGGSRLSNPVVFAPGEEKTIELRYAGSVRGDVTKTLSFDPALQFNGKTNSKKVGDLLIRIALPEGVNSLLWSNSNYVASSEEEGRATYVWAGRDFYPTTLTVKWSTLAVDLSVAKNAFPRTITEPGQVITIELTLINNGGKLEGLMLTDDYSPSEFEGVEPAQEFLLTSNESSNELRLFWLKRLDLLQPNETKTLTYSIRYVGDISQMRDISLKPLTVMADEHLIAVSNEATISVIPATVVVAGAPDGETTTPVPQEKPSKPAGTNQTLALALAAVLLLIVLSLAVLFVRKKRKSSSSPK